LPASYPAAYLNLVANSGSDASVDSQGHITQDFSGWFKITSSTRGAGANYASGTFVDAVFGTGTGLVMTASGPSGVPTLSSNEIGALDQMRAISLSFASVTPPAYVTGKMTLGAFTSSVSGNLSATPEPASLALLSISLTAILAFRRRFKRKKVA
jgi:hypothetical protein